MKEEKLDAAARVKELTGEAMPDTRSEKELKEEKEKKILCLIGTAYSRHKAPYDNPNAEFWGVGHCLLLDDIKKMDKIFEIHFGDKVYETEISPFSKKPLIYHANKEDRLYQKVQEGDLKVVTGSANPKINNYELLPRDYLKAEYGDLLPSHDAFYATNSIAWMIVWALDLMVKQGKYDEVHLYGIHLETSSEWQYERPCNEWWLGNISGYMLGKYGKKGVIKLPEESDVCRGYHEYGFADIEIRRKKLQGKLDFYSKAVADMDNQIKGIVNRLNTLKNERNTPVEEKIKWMEAQIKKFNSEIKTYIDCQDKGKFIKDLNQKIDNEIVNMDQQLRQLENRASAFNGAKEQKEYDLMELNA